MASDALVARLVGGLLLATGVLVILLGGLCTGWLVLPDTVRSLKFEGFFRTLVELWLPSAGGMMTIVIGVLLARGPSPDPRCGCRHFTPGVAPVTR